MYIPLTILRPGNLVSERWLDVGRIRVIHGLRLNSPRLSSTMRIIQWLLLLSINWWRWIGAGSCSMVRSILLRCRECHSGGCMTLSEWDVFPAARNETESSTFTGSATVEEDGCEHRQSNDYTPNGQAQDDVTGACIRIMFRSWLVRTIGVTIIRDWK